MEVNIVYKNGNIVTNISYIWPLKQDLPCHAHNADENVNKIRQCAHIPANDEVSCDMLQIHLNATRKTEISSTIIP